MTQNWGQPAGGPTPPAEQTFTPDPKQYLNWIGRGFAAIGILIVVFFISGRNIGNAATVITMGVTAVIAFGIMMLRIVTTSITVRPDAIEYKNLFGSQRLPRTGLIGLMAPYKVLADNRKARLLVAHDPHHGGRLRLNGALWADDALDAVAWATQLPMYTEPLTAKQFEAAAPGTMRYYDKHPFLLAFGIVAIIIVVAVVAVLVFADF